MCSSIASEQTQPTEANGGIAQVCSCIWHITRTRYNERSKIAFTQQKAFAAPFPSGLVSIPEGDIYLGFGEAVDAGSVI